MLEEPCILVGTRIVSFSRPVVALDYRTTGLQDYRARRARRVISLEMSIVSSDLKRSFVNVESKIPYEMRQ